MGGVLTLSLESIFPAAFFGLGRGIYCPRLEDVRPIEKLAKHLLVKKLTIVLNKPRTALLARFEKRANVVMIYGPLRASLDVAKPSRFFLGTTSGFQYLASIRGKSKVGDYQEDWRVRAQRTTRRNIDPNEQKRELLRIHPRCAKKKKLAVPSLRAKPA